MSQSTHSSGSDNQLVEAIVQNVKSRGIFDEFRRECLSDADTKPSFQNLLQRVEGYVSKFLSQQKWNQNINKNHLRERLRTQINESGMLKYGIEHLVEQVVNYKINSLFWPKIEGVVKEFLGIQEIPFVPTIPTVPTIPSFEISKIGPKKSIKTENKLNIKVEPKKVESIEDTSQPMDIETDSNSSVGNKNIEIKKEAENIIPDDSDNAYVDWPTPPMPEMLTPDRQQLVYSPIDTKEGIKLIEESNCDSIVTKNENLFYNQIKENETFLINKQIMNELKDEKNIESIDDNRNEDKDKEVSELSDVSSVHTSDLSDFDDEISLDDSNDELKGSKDSKKKKLSLKVVKKITEVLSNEQIGNKNIKTEPKVQKQSPTEEENSDKCLQTMTKSETKRIRKVNPKYSSEEFSSIFTDKDRVIHNNAKEGFDDTNNDLNKSLKIESDPKTSSRRRRHSNGSDNDSKEVIELSANRSSESIKRLKELPTDSRSSSRGSIESSLSETTQDSTQSQTRSQRRKISKNRNESQTQRYDASDLYKPRPVFSRRPRGPTTPDSSTPSNDDFVIHDLSK